MSYGNTYRPRDDQVCARRGKGQAIQRIAYAALATESTNCSPQTWLDRQEEAKRQWSGLQASLHNLAVGR